VPAMHMARTHTQGHASPRLRGAKKPKTCLTANTYTPPYGVRVHRDSLPNEAEAVTNVTRKFWQSIVSRCQFLHGDSR